MPFDRVAKIFKSDELLYSSVSSILEISTISFTSHPIIKNKILVIKMYSTRIPQNRCNFLGGVHEIDRKMFAASIENDVQREPYADHTASFLSRQARFCNPVLATANGLLLFSAEHRKFAERKWGCGAEDVQRDEQKGTSKSGWSYECEKKRDEEKERESDEER